MTSPEAAVENLQELRRWLDDYGSTPDSRRKTWDELLDDYDVSLGAVAHAHGVEVPAGPTAIQRRFTRIQREELERALTAAGVSLLSASA